MEKYDGMNKVSVVLAPALSIDKRVKSKRFKLFLINCLVAVLLAVCVFAGKFLPIPGYSKFTDAVKNAVCFDIIDYAEEKLKSDEN